ncbi:MAG: Kelch repeat-containing protein [Flavobacteriaceae bacterium]
MKTKTCLLMALIILAGCTKDEEPEQQNRAPGTFSVTTLASENSATISWSKAVDPDGDTVVYTVTLENETLVSGGNGLEINKTGLSPETSYSGKVIASDPQGLSSEKTFNFTTSNTPNASPSASALNSPEKDETGVVLTPIFNWGSSSDPDGDAITYDLYLDMNSNPSAKVGADLSDTSFETPSSLSLNTMYYWKVVAKDGKGGESVSETYTFTTNAPPSAIILEIPVNNALNQDPVDVEFKWEVPSDPDGDQVVFDFYLDQNSNPTTLVYTDFTDLPYSPQERLESESTYYWKVVAKDGKGGSTVSEIRSFSTSVSLAGEEATDDAGFSIRYGHSSVVFNNKMWVIGGNRGSGSGTNDVWSSDDGTNWTEVTANAAFSARFEHASVVFDNKIWVIGGRVNSSSSGERNDVWYSGDGINWTQATANAAFAPRYIHEVLVYNGKMWLISGRTQNSQPVDEEVWSSSDGISWELETDTAGFCCRGASAVVFNNKMWYIGGFSDNVYSSTDGVNWTTENNQAEFDARANHSSVVYDNKIWVIGGTNASNTGLKFNDVWYSEDGISWIEAAKDGGFAPRASHSSVALNNKIWVIAGDAGGLGVPFFNDVWYLE